MADLSKLSDEELLSALNGGGPAPDVQSMSDEDLMRALSGPEQPAQAVEQSDERPWYEKAGQAADDIVRLGLDGLSFGYMDQLAGHLGGEGAEAERAKTQAARERAGLAGTVAEIGGGVMGAGKLAQGAGALARGAQAVIPGAARAVQAGSQALSAAPAAARYGAGLAGAAAGGAGLGALSAAGHDEDVATGAGIGAVAGAGGKVAGDLISAGVNKAAGVIGRAVGINRPPQIMTREQLKEASQAAYKASEDAGLIVKPEALQRLTKDVQGALVKKGYHPEINPEVRAVLSELDRISQGNATLQGVDVLRQIADGARGATNAKTKALGGEIIEKIDDFLDGLGVGDVLMGNKTQGVTALKEARRLWASQKKSEMIEGAIERATNQAAASGTGGNVDNAIRQQFKNILNNPKKSRGLTPDEKATMQLIVRGTKGQNLARLVGRLSPQGNGLMLLLHGTGGIATGGATVPLAAVGAAGKAIADRATPANVRALDELVRAGGNADALRTQPNAVQRLAESKRDALARALTVGGIITAP